MLVLVVKSRLLHLIVVDFGVQGHLPPYPEIPFRMKPYLKYSTLSTCNVDLGFHFGLDHGGCKTKRCDFNIACSVEIVSRNLNINDFLVVLYYLIHLYWKLKSFVIRHFFFKFPL